MSKLNLAVFFFVYLFSLSQAVALDIKTYIDSNDWVHKKSLAPDVIELYEHKKSKLPLAIIKGGHTHEDGTFEPLCLIIYFRSRDDDKKEMNLKMEGPFGEHAKSYSEFISFKYSNDKPLEENECQQYWKRFEASMIGDLSGRLRFSQSDNKVESKVNTNDVAPENDSEDKCMICLSAKPATKVLPCEHKVVCEECSNKLPSTNDNKICVQCRCPITKVVYSDGKEVLL